MGPGFETPGIAGTGTVATGLAACASAVGPVVMLARSDESALKAERRLGSIAERLDGADLGRVRFTTDVSELSDCDVVVEAIVEDLQTKGELIGEVGRTAPRAALASTTSALSIHEIGEMSGHASRLFGLHVFNPVAKMELVELCFTKGLDASIPDRARAWCEGIGKRGVEVPDQAGFVVNRLLFPYLFDAVHMMERTGMSAEDVDACMTLGAGHPMGPLALLDLVGLDVAMAIGEALYEESELPAHQPPELLRALVSERKLGRKTGAGFHDYD